MLEPVLALLSTVTWEFAEITPAHTEAFHLGFVDVPLIDESDLREGR